MKLVCLVLFGLVCVSYQTPLKTDAFYQHEFRGFVEKFGKTYKDDAERTMRFNTFVENVNKLDEYAKTHPTVKFEINKFSDWTQEEKSKLMGVKAPVVAPKEAKISHKPHEKAHTLPASFDWRTRNVVTPVKDQGGCGSCWTFQAVAVLESHVLLGGNPEVILSEQEIVDCDHIFGTAGCEGGTGNSALTYVIQNKLATEQQYPYRGTDQKCHANYNQTGRTTLKQIQLLSNDENNAAYQLTQLGPLGYNIWVPDSLFSYSGGVYYPTEAECLKAQKDDAGHAITLVGFGTENNVDYWIIKNSWGAGWGDQGYFKMHRGNLTCAIAYANPTDPLMNSGWFLAITK